MKNLVLPRPILLMALLICKGIFLSGSFAQSQPEHWQSLNDNSKISVNGISNTSKENSTSLNLEENRITDTFCDYFPLPKKMVYTYIQSGGFFGDEIVREEYSYIGDKIIDGKPYRGYKISSTDVNKDGKVAYYNCSDGVFSNCMRRYNYVQEQTGYEEDIFGNRTPVYEYVEKPTDKFISWTEFKAGESVGATWTEEQIVQKGVATVTSTIEEKGLTLIVNYKKYTDVMKISRKVYQNVLGEKNLIAKQDVYYAKGVGRIKSFNEGVGGLLTNTEELISYTSE
jgi:hypothetical protein